MTRALEFRDRVLELGIGVLMVSIRVGVKVKIF